ncbi:hypothetical protein KL930_001911 [Ogataea haglerorum]|uniref:Rpr2-domain-containing protein n=1 Tax=Ogataea haglerorum TaxID=1937702 RepID=A0AAN6I217_9ASCO|nr:uncharacterized protein KL911_001852 [Ogataea haglerorum]KAG7698250.1 hypothetical protein KL915_001967 [Ogataea haglerorum]KAG7699457.1 hypothetical protein KL951_001174 [Ogataea haglerorum]KAG7710501.1 hypothetical protein KL950_001414 [Ogataea haglerorum]KAG7730116.1 hypothetical protein KL933_001196 [Ogataea haglerorum]KAG7740348.1 hypothetical protein KL923_002189 [Ogataea haglerorum]
MKKQNPAKTPRPPKTVPKNDHYQRLGFLYQAAARLDPDSALSRMYLRNMDVVAKKTVLKLDPSVKRTLCKKCHRLQVPGRTASIRIENTSNAQSPENDVLAVSCVCGALKRYPIGRDRNYVLFSEQNEIRDS